MMKEIRMRKLYSEQARTRTCAFDGCSAVLRETGAAMSCCPPTCSRSRPRGRWGPPSARLPSRCRSQQRVQAGSAQASDKAQASNDQSWAPCIPPSTSGPIWTSARPLARCLRQARARPNRDGRERREWVVLVVVVPLALSLLMYLVLQVSIPFLIISYNFLYDSEYIIFFHYQIIFIFNSNFSTWVFTI